MGGGSEKENDTRMISDNWFIPCRDSVMELQV